MRRGDAGRLHTIHSSSQNSSITAPLTRLHCYTPDGLNRCVRCVPASVRLLALSCRHHSQPTRHLSQVGNVNARRKSLMPKSLCWTLSCAGCAIPFPPLRTLLGDGIGHRSHPSNFFDGFFDLDGRGRRRHLPRPADQLQLQSGRDWHGDVSRGPSMSVALQRADNLIAGRTMYGVQDRSDRYGPHRPDSGDFRPRCAVLRPLPSELGPGARSPRPQLTVCTYTASRILPARVLM